MTPPSSIVVSETLECLTVQLPRQKDPSQQWGLTGPTIIGLVTLMAWVQGTMPIWLLPFMAGAYILYMAQLLTRKQASRSDQYTLHLTETQLLLPDHTLLLEHIYTVVPLEQTLHLQTSGKGYELPLHMSRQEQTWLLELLQHHLRRRRQVLGITHPVPAEVPAALQQLMGQEPR